MLVSPEGIPESFDTMVLRLLGEERPRRAGWAQGAQHSLFRVLEARGLWVTMRQRKRILACTDMDALGGLVTKAVSVASVRDLLRGNPVVGGRRTKRRAPPKRTTARAKK